MTEWTDSLINGTMTTHSGYKHDRPIDTSPKPTACWVCGKKHPSRKAASRCTHTHTPEERIAAGGDY